MLEDAPNDRITAAQIVEGLMTGVGFCEKPNCITNTVSGARNEHKAAKQQSLKTLMINGTIIT